MFALPPELRRDLKAAEQASASRPARGGAERRQARRRRTITITAAISVDPTPVPVVREGEERQLRPVEQPAAGRATEELAGSERGDEEGDRRGEDRPRRRRHDGLSVRSRRCSTRRAEGSAAPIEPPEMRGHWRRPRAGSRRTRRCRRRRTAVIDDRTHARRSAHLVGNFRALMHCRRRSESGLTSGDAPPASAPHHQRRPAGSCAATPEVRASVRRRPPCEARARTAGFPLAAEEAASVDLRGCGIRGGASTGSSFDAAGRRHEHVHPHDPARSTAGSGRWSDASSMRGWSTTGSSTCSNLGP